jgi:CrcB protein
VGPTDFPTATWLINTSGALLIGVIATFLTARPGVAPWWRLLLVTGVLGAWTTMSSIAAETDGLVHHGGGSVLLAIGYLAATATAGVIGCAAGVVLGRVVAGAETGGVGGSGPRRGPGPR